MNQSETIDALRLTVDKLTEQIAIMNNRRFGKFSEKALVTGDQLSILDFGFNEAEFTVDTASADEPEMETAIVKRRKRKGKREEDLSAFPVIPVIHELSKDELEEKFPDGYKEDSIGPAISRYVLFTVYNPSMHKILKKEEFLKNFIKNSHFRARKNLTACSQVFTRDIERYLILFPMLKLRQIILKLCSSFLVWQIVWIWHMSNQIIQ